MKGLLCSTCCPPEPPLPDNLECFKCDVANEWTRLFKRYRKMVTHNRHLNRLSKPKYIVNRFIRRCPCRFTKTIEVQRLYLPMHTRTEQLAFPQFRKMMLFKQMHMNKLTPKQQEAFNRRMRLSLLSLYSRLENIQPPVPPVPKHKWTKDEWKIHRRHFKKLAQPKKLVLPPKQPKEFRDLKSMKRFKKLAKPKFRFVPEKDLWVLTPGIKYYTASDRMVQLATPKMFDDTQLYQPLPTPVSPGAKKYKASERILQLAIPAEKRAMASDLKDNPFGISPFALKAKPSRRTEELAEPKEYENTHFKENAFSVSPKALKAKATPRLIELAKPKGS